MQVRQLLDAALIANELVDLMKKSGESGFMIKVDFENRMIVEVGSSLNLQWIKWVLENNRDHGL